MDTEQLPPIQLNSDAFASLVRKQLISEMEAKGIGEDALSSLQNAKNMEQKFISALRIWKNGGYLRYSDRFTKFSTRREAWDNRMTYEGMVDAMATPDATMLMPKVISQIIREAVEPQLTLTSLFRRIDFSAGTSITFPAMSAMKGVRDIGEGQEYPELAGPRFAGTVTVKMGKTAGAVRVTEELLRYSQWDIMSMLFKVRARPLLVTRKSRSTTRSTTTRLYPLITRLLRPRITGRRLDVASMRSRTTLFGLTTSSRSMLTW